MLMSDCFLSALWVKLSAHHVQIFFITLIFHNLLTELKQRGVWLIWPREHSSRVSHITEHNRVKRYLRDNLRVSSGLHWWGNYLPSFSNTKFAIEKHNEALWNNIFKIWLQLIIILITFFSGTLYFIFIVKSSARALNNCTHRTMQNARKNSIFVTRNYKKIFFVYMLC